jgi:hypothetical protein
MSYQPRTHTPSNPRTRSVFDPNSIRSFVFWSGDPCAWPYLDQHIDVAPCGKETLVVRAGDRTFSGDVPE